jgi:hypothetical protein
MSQWAWQKFRCHFNTFLSAFALPSLRHPLNNLQRFLQCRSIAQSWKDLIEKNKNIHKTFWMANMDNIGNYIIKVDETLIVLQ